MAEINPLQTQENPPAPILSWSAPSTPNHERSARWYTVGGIIVLLGAIYGILSGSWAFSIVVLLCGGIYFLMRGSIPTLKNISIAEQGVLYEGSFVNWNDCTGFWLIQTPEYTELHISRKNLRLGEIMIQTGPVDIAIIRSTLSQFLQELSDKQESLLDTIIRICKL